ncbi:hypothetical protein [Anaerocolumna aminovalerica]|uniref:hypothetical protein n=1 Tax=Anaerocolumna aminovalerica TaxID=1527 RepID=UPI0011141A32|nr:hypothetical protein [Anaerocolumna aminovalerica]
MKWKSSGSLSSNGVGFFESRSITAFKVIFMFTSIIPTSSFSFFRIKLKEELVRIIWMKKTTLPNLFVEHFQNASTETTSVD